MTDKEYMMLSTLTPRQKDYVLMKKASNDKSVGMAYLFAFLFSAHYFYLGKPLKNVVLWCLIGIWIGAIWWIFDLFRMSSLVNEVNEQRTAEYINEALTMYPEGF